MEIQINNLNPSLIEADVQRLFAPFGEVSSVRIIRDKLNNRSSGKALVSMPVEKEGEKAIASLMGFSLAGKSISVTNVSSTQIEGLDHSILTK